MTYDKNENDRASRIALRVNEYHLLWLKFMRTWSTEILTP